MHFVTNDGAITLETTDVSLRITRELMDELSFIAPLSKEILYYKHIDYLIRYKLSENPNRRRFIISIPDEHNPDLLGCISVIQFLIRDAANKMIVYMRSSSTAIIASDLGYLSRLAKRYSIDECVVHIGSLHTCLN